MRRDDSETKEKIIEATIALLSDDERVGDITIRDIAARVGIGVGLINYHFQTKENLINLCVQRKVSGVIGRFEALYRSLDGQRPLDKLRCLLKSTGAYLASNPGISRTSIQSDMLAPHENDNTCQTLAAYYPVVREVCEGRKTEDEMRLLLHTLVGALQVAFLRNDVCARQLSADFYDKEQRDALIDKIVDVLFSEFL